MGKLQKGRVADLSRILQRVTASLNEAFLLLNEAAPAGSVKGDWSEVKKAADLVSKNSTTIGLLWTQGPKVDEAAEAMKTFADSLQGLILLCHGYTVGAGPTLALTIRNAVKAVLDAGLSLLARVVSFSVKGSAKEEREAALPALVGCVWEACNAMKKTPFTNRAAIGRSLAQVATSVKDVLREIGDMREGKPADQADDCGCGHSHDETVASASHSHSHDHGHGPCGHDHGHDHDHDHSGHLHTHDHSDHGQCGHDHSHGGHSHSGHGHSHAPVHAHGHSHGHNHGPSGHSHAHYPGHEDCGHDHGDESVESLEFNDELSPEEMEVADATKGVITSVLDFVKQLLYVAADPQQGNDESSTLYLENVLKHCKSLGVEVDEFGASLYPPQEINQLRDRITKSDALMESIKEEVKAAKGSVPEALDAASETVRNAQAELKQCLGGLL
ncbi:hypothetical protein KC19_7G128300 [Ceratodon purpureus]|uniref:Uncharacterized protein n=1 Tax=Ceratodon purpureus TaxID=3225 RepID=A0A8T0H7X6_CERPU|nr:hypothetical protein KC19_7G128300 [Ceratodon purpureus]